MNRAKPSAPSRQKLIPGQPCPAERNNSHGDPRVTITESGNGWRRGLRTCGLCGRPGVAMHQAHGAHHSAWYYAPHTVPALEGYPEGNKNA